MSNIVSSNGKETPSEWLLERFESLQDGGWISLQTHTSRNIIQLISDHPEECTICEILDNGKTYSWYSKDFMQWRPGDPVVP